MNSDYSPVHTLPHRQLLTVPVIAERVWVLYTMHYLRRGQLFEHIFADCLQLTGTTQDWEYVRMNCANYFLWASQSREGEGRNNRMVQVCEGLEWHGLRRVIPIVVANMPSEETRVCFVNNLINAIYCSSSSQGQ